MYFELDNDDMESSKRRSIFISLTFILRLSKITSVNCKNLRQLCSSLRSPQSSSKSQTNSVETHRSFLQRNSVGEQVATKNKNFHSSVSQRTLRLLPLVGEKLDLTVVNSRRTVLKFIQQGIFSILTTCINGLKH